MRKSVAIVLAAVCTFSLMPAHADAGEVAAHRYYTVNGASLYVETFGSGPPIVFLHGGLGFFDMNFARQRDYFAPSRKVIGIDRRGHGHSPDTAEPFSYQGMADDTAAVLEQ